jgi:hypothetical protein
MAKPDVTPEIVGEFGRTTTLRLVGAVFAFLLIANITAYVLLAWHPINRGNWLVHEKWKLLDRAPDVDTLILGDSSCNQGVVPQVLDEKLGGRSLNLCTIGNALAVNDAWMLDDYLAKHPAPKRVIVVHVYDMWTRDADYTFVRLLGKIPRSFGFWNDMNPPVHLDMSDYEDLVSSKFLPLHSESTSLMTWIQSPREALHTHFQLDERGFMNVTTPAPKRVAENLKKHLRELADLPTIPTLPNQRALARLAELAEHHHIDMVFANSPMVDALWASPELQHYLAVERTALRQSLGPSPHVRVLDGPPRTFSAIEMENVDHVVGAAATTFTEWLAQRIRERP